MVKKKAPLILWIFVFPPMLAVTVCLLDRLMPASRTYYPVQLDLLILGLVMIYTIYVLRKPNSQR